MQRRTLQLWSLLCSAFCLAMWMVWKRSFGHDFWWQISPGGKIYALKLRGGLLSLYRLDHGGPRGKFLTTLGELWIYYPLVICIFLCFVLALYAIRRRRGIAGRCPVCDYDLRATPNQCPECGATAL
jgi:TRAP-type C4-dicarboxylate transport system permease small subunit